MEKTVFLNAERINFDGKLDFSIVEECGPVTLYPESSRDEIVGRVKDQNIVVTKEMTLDQELIRRFPPSVHLICEAGTGYNNIDIAAAVKKGIRVCNVPGYSTDAVAQLVITFILALSSSLAAQQTMIRQNNYDNFYHFLGVPHHEVSHKTLGVVGAGAIGQRVMQSARALGMNVLYYNRSPKAFGDPGIVASGLDELLKNSDFITLHCPLTKETLHLIDKEKLERMKPSAFLINTARGAIINETDLIEALKSGKIAGAALDVLETEPPRPENELFRMDQVLLTPHIGWKCTETRQRLLKEIAAEIAAFQSGSPINIVG